MKRREFVKRGLMAGASPAFASGVAAAGQGTRGRIIDAHCHAGRGLNYGRDNPPSDPWTTYNDPPGTLRRMEEVGIDQTIIFPINNTTCRRRKRPWSWAATSAGCSVCEMRLLQGQAPVPALAQGNHRGLPLRARLCGQRRRAGTAQAAGCPCEHGWARNLGNGRLACATPATRGRSAFRNIRLAK